MPILSNFLYLTLVFKTLLFSYGDNTVGGNEIEGKSRVQWLRENYIFNKNHTGIIFSLHNKVTLTSEEKSFLRQDIVNNFNKVALLLHDDSEKGIGIFRSELEFWKNTSQNTEISVLVSKTVDLKKLQRTRSCPDDLLDVPEYYYLEYESNVTTWSTTINYLRGANLYHMFEYAFNMTNCSSLLTASLPEHKDKDVVGVNVNKSAKSFVFYFEETQETINLGANEMFENRRLIMEKCQQLVLKWDLDKKVKVSFMMLHYSTSSEFYDNKPEMVKFIEYWQRLSHWASEVNTTVILSNAIDSFRYFKKGAQPFFEMGWWRLGVGTWNESGWINKIQDALFRFPELNVTQTAPTPSERTTRTELTTTENTTTWAITTENAITEDAITENWTTENAITKNWTTENVTENWSTENAITEDAITENWTTENAITKNWTTENVTTENVTTENVTTENAITENWTTEKTTREKATTENAITKNVTARPVTTQPLITAENATTENPITEPTTTEKVKTEPTTTQPITKRPATTESKTTEPTTTKNPTTVGSTTTGSTNTEQIAATEHSQYDSNTNATVYVILSIVLSLSVVAVVIIATIFLIRRKNRKPILTKQEINDFFHGEEPSLEFRPLHVAYQRPYEKTRYEIEMDIVTFVEDAPLLGSGDFGKVCLGEIIVQQEETSQVAIKMLNPKKIHKAAVKRLLSEIKMLSYVGNHDHIIQFIGANTDDIKSGKVFLFLELCEFGSLDSHLRKLKLSLESDDRCSVITVEEQMNDMDEERMGRYLQMMSMNKTPLDPSVSEDLLRWSYEICMGMAFLVSKNVVHANLTARNVLLNAEKDVKISNFGVIRQIDNDKNGKKKEELEPLHWKWMAPETLKLAEFSEKSDVWAYGVTLWQIFNLGAQPFSGVAWSGGFADLLEAGYRLGEPEYNDLNMYSVMRECWIVEAQNRPSFSELLATFSS